MTLTLREPDLTNLHPATDEETGRGHLSHSSIGTQLACLRRWGWRYFERLELIEEGWPRSMGRAFHIGLEHGSPARAREALFREVHEPAAQERMQIQQAIAEAATHAYMGRWPIEQRRELKYRIRLRNPATGAWSRTFDLVGAADGIVDHGDYLELVEDKLVGRVDALTVHATKLDRQIGLSCYALWRITGKPVRVVRKRFVKRPAIKRKQNESHDEFLRRIHDDYEERPDFYVHEEPTFRSADDLLTLEAELWDWAEQRRNAIARKFFARNTASCGDYGGCDYIPLCVNEPDAPNLYRRISKEALAHVDEPD